MTDANASATAHQHPPLPSCFQRLAPKPRINIIDPKTLFTPEQKAQHDVAVIRQRLEQQFPRLKHNIYIRDDEDPLADNVASSPEQSMDQLTMQLDSTEINEQTDE